MSTISCVNDPKCNQECNLDVYDPFTEYEHEVIKTKARVAMVIMDLPMKEKNKEKLDNLINDIEGLINNFYITL